METKLCRICGNLGNNFVHIFNTEGLKDKIETCLPIIVSPYCLLPDTICMECIENVDSFYVFMKKCLQNIIILETQYDIQESCLKSKRKKEKGCYVDFTIQRSSVSVQTEDYLDILVGKDTDLKEYSSSFPLITTYLDSTEQLQPKLNTSLVDYDVDSDSNVDENDTNTGTVILGEKLETLNRITNLVDSFLSKKSHFTSKRQYFDDAENDLISEISRRKKRKLDAIENSQTKICNLNSFNRRKAKQPKKFESVFSEDPKEAPVNFQSLTEVCHNENENLPPDLEQKDSSFSDADNQQLNSTVLDKRLMSSLPQSCLLCDTHFSGPAALATHVFETHGIDLAEVVSSGESSSEKKKKIPNLVKISDLKRSDSTEENQLLDQQPEDPPMLLPSFVCPNCPAVFTTKPDLMMHLRLKHAQQAAYLCGLCHQQCNSYVNLKTHLQACVQHHPLNTRYVCQICQYGDDNFKSLENHVLVHDFLLEACKKQARMFDPADYINTNEDFEAGALSPSSKSLNCGECGLGDFESFKEFSSHRRSQHSIFHCDLCNKFYGRNSHLWKHVNRLHKGHPSITCQMCYKTSASKYHLAQHFNKIHLTKGTKQKADGPQAEKEDFMSQKFQGFDFQSVKQSFMKQEIIEQELKNSISEMEDNSNQPSDQDDEANSEGNLPAEPSPKTDVNAPKEIDSSHNLYTNIITNYTPPLNEGEHKCPKCSKAFHKKVLLKKHKKNCRPKLQKDLLTRCKTCARIFKDRQSLAKHLVNYHSEYACEICGEKVQSKCEIVSHIRFQHPGCRLFCKICSNILRSEEDLQTHLRDHLDSYVCQFCGDSLPSKIKLKMHILSLHRKILSLSCGICLKLFETQHILKDHVTLVHKDQLAPLTSCPVCGKNYGSKWKTYDHLNKSHGRIFKACKTCLEVFDNDAQLQAHCDVNAHGGQGVSGINTSAIRNSIMAHVTSAINIVATQNEIIANNEEEESESGEENEENSDQSNDEYENDVEDVKEEIPLLPPETKISLLEKRLLGKRPSEDDQLSRGARSCAFRRSNDISLEARTKPYGDTKRDKNQTEVLTITNVKKEDDPEPEHSPSNPQVNSSKRTVYVNSNAPSRCEICFKTWPAKKHLWQHYIRCHKSVAATVCGICLKTNETYNSLQTHLRENHPTLLHGQGFGSNFICRICGRYHNASSKLRLHMVIHENFDWSSISEIPKVTKRNDDKKFETNGYKDVKEEPANDSTEVYDDNYINYDSLIEQVECSSQSENDDSENERERVETKEEGNTSSGEEDEEEEESEASALSENSMQAQMLKNMLNEKRHLNSKVKRKGYASTSEESSSSFTDDNNERTKSESSDDEEESRSESSHGKFNVRSNSDTVESALEENVFRTRPDELDSAIKSISYECMKPEEIKIEDDYCELHNNCLNENEIESAVGSIL